MNWLNKLNMIILKRIKKKNIKFINLQINLTRNNSMNYDFTVYKLTILLIILINHKYYQLIFNNNYNQLNRFNFYLYFKRFD